MSVLVKLSTTLRDCVPGYDPVAGMEVDISAHGELSAEGLAAVIGIPRAEIKIVMVNGRQSALPTAVRDGDRVAYFPAVGGG